MTANSALMLLALAGAVSGCGGAAASDSDVLPGRSRPLLHHDWTHPRDLRSGTNRFEPPDPRSALLTTASGLRAYVIPAADDGVVQITAALPFGRALEQANETGAADLLSRLLAQQIEQRLGRTFTGRVQTEQEIDLTRVSLQMLADDWRSGLSAVVAGVRTITLDPAEIEAYRSGPGYVRPTRGLGGAGFRPAVELARLLGEYPVAPPAPGLSVPRDAVGRVAARSLRPDAVVLGIGGGVSRADAQRELESLTAGWHAGAVTMTRTSSGGASGAASGDRVRTIDEPGFTTWIALGHPTPPIAAADEAPIAVMTDVLNIRLNIAAREMRGLANQIVLQAPATVRHAGLLHVRTGGRPESVAPLIHYARQELSRIREDAGLASSDELEQVKGGLILSKWQASLDGARASSATYAVETVRRGSLDHLMSWPAAVRVVTAQVVRQAAQKYVHPEAMGIIVIGPLDEIRKARHPRWPLALDDVLLASRR